MAVQHHVRNPIEWGWDRLKDTGHAIGSAASTMDGAWDAHGTAPPVVRKIGLDDIEGRQHPLRAIFGIRTAAVRGKP